MESMNIMGVRDAVLVKAGVHARIEGLLLEATLKQIYVNARATPL